MKKGCRITICLAAALLLLFSQAAVAAADTEITNWEGLKKAVQAADDGATLIISGDLTADSNITITDKKITLVAGAGGAVITRGDSLTADAIFTVKSGKAALTLGQAPGDSAVIILDGGSLSIQNVEAPLIYVYDDAQLILNSGTLRNNNNIADSSWSMNSNSGGGVYVGTSKTGSARDKITTASRFTMNGGTLENFSAARAGGGVFVHRGATFEMNGGAFSNCNANKGKYNNTPYGGGIYAYGGDVTIRGTSRFTNCTAGTADSAGFGGAISAKTGDDAKTGALQISGSVRFSGTAAAGAVGGPCGVYAYGLKTLSVDNAAFSDLLFNGNPNSASGAIQVSQCETAVIQNTSFTHCKGSYRGGALMVGSEGAVIENCTFSDCSSTRTGGALQFTGYSAAVKDTTITNCSAKSDGGAVYVDQKSKVTMENVTIEGCQASYGSGIYVNAAGISEAGGTDANTFLTLDDKCVIKNCGAAQEGGGIYIERRGQVLLNGAKITNCTANTGGGIFVHYQNDHGPKVAFLQVSGGAQVTGNTASNVYFEDDSESIEVIGNLTDEAKIGYTCKTYSPNRIIAQKTTGKLDAAAAAKFICDNSKWQSAINSEGQVILDMIASDPWSSLAKQIAAASAGTAEKPTVIKVSGEFATNKDIGTINITGKHIQLVPAGDADVKISRDSNHTGNFFTIGNGGSLTIGSSPEDTAVITLDGNDIENCGALINLAGGNFTLKSGTLSNNNASYGGAVYMNNAASQLTLSGGAITDCTASHYGGAVYMYGSKGISLNGGSISGCQAKEMGGAVMAWGGEVAFSSGAIKECTAPNGGGIYGYTGSTVTMTGGTISDCSADYGGAIRANAAQAFIMNNGTISACQAKEGGAVYASAANALTLNNGTISACQATDGGAIYATAEQSVTMNDGIISACKATANGGAVCANKANAFTMNKGKIADCTAVSGGGAICVSSANNAVVIKSGTISNCTATWGGGLFFYNDCSATAENLSFEGCTASNFGGGVYLMTRSGLQLTECVFNGCQSGYRAGGIFADSADLSIRDSEITQCTAQVQGGGLFVESGTLTIAGQLKAEDNQAGTSADQHLENIYLSNGCLIKAAGALDQNAVIGVTSANPAEDMVIAEGAGYTLLERDVDCFKYDSGAYTVSLNNANQAVLKKAVTSAVTVEKEGEGVITCVYEGGGDAVITLTPEYGYKLAALYVEEQQVPKDQITADRDDPRSSVYSFTPTANVVVKAIFGQLTKEEVEAKIDTELPDLVDELEPEEVKTILDVKADYEALPEEAKNEIDADYADYLHKALSKVDGISVEVVYADGTPADVDIQDLHTLLYGMGMEEVKDLKADIIKEYKLIVTVKPLGTPAAVQE